MRDNSLSGSGIRYTYPVYAIRYTLSDIRYPVYARQNPSEPFQSVVVSASALPSSPVLSTASADVSSTLFDNTVAPSRFHPYQDKTLVLKRKFE